MNLDNRIRLSIQRLSLLLLKDTNPLIKKLRDQLYKDLFNKKETLSLIQAELYTTKENK
jgi:hypothetical protein